MHGIKAKHFCKVSFDTGTTHIQGIIVVNFQWLGEQYNMDKWFFPLLNKICSIIFFFNSNSNSKFSFNSALFSSNSRDDNFNFFFQNWQNLSMFAIELLKNTILNFFNTYPIRKSKKFWCYKMCSPQTFIQLRLCNI